MSMRKYYAVTTKMTFEKTVLIPIECAKDIEDAIDMVECGVETANILLLNETADCDTIQCPYADVDGVYELSGTECEGHQILRRDIYTALTYKDLEADSGEDMLFTVPKEWAEEWFEKRGYLSKSYELNYTYEDTAEMYQDAEEEDMLLFTAEKKANEALFNYPHVTCDKYEKDGKIIMSIYTTYNGCDPDFFTYEELKADATEDEKTNLWKKMKLKAAVVSSEEKLPLYIYDAAKSMD